MEHLGLPDIRGNSYHDTHYKHIEDQNSREGWNRMVSQP